MTKTVLPLLIFILGTTSCVQAENSNSQDAETYSNIGGRAGFTQVRAILRQNCANCHVYHTMSEEQMIAAGVLKLGDAASSAIYYRLTGSTAGGGPKSMPVGGSLSVADLLTIEDWISNAN